MSILTCKELNVSYDQTQALKDVSFELNEGDYLCIVGDNVNEINFRIGFS